MSSVTATGTDYHNFLKLFQRHLVNLYFVGMSNLKIEVCHLWHAYVTDSSVHQITWILNLMRNRNLMLHTPGSYSVKNH